MLDDAAKTLVDCSCEHSEQPQLNESFTNHCADVARKEQESPVGTANRFDRFVLVEVPLPWPQRMRMVPWARTEWPQRTISVLNEAVESSHKVAVRTKFIGIAPDEEYSNRQHPRAFILEKTNHYARMARESIDLFTQEGEQRLNEICSKPLGTLSVPSSTVRDLLVCTHGQIDSCCGRLGVPLYQALRLAVADKPDTRVWRCSAIGGHRFAPTVLDMPEGRMWGHLDEEDIPILLNQMNIDALITKYRGSVCVESQINQFVERDVFRHFGWNIVQSNVTFKKVGEQIETLVKSGDRIERFISTVSNVNEGKVFVDCKGATSIVTRPVVSTKRCP